MVMNQIDLPENKIKEVHRGVNWTYVAIAGFVVLGLISWGYIGSIKEKTALEQQKFESSERIKKEEMTQKQEQDKKEYIAKRKTDCLAIYKTEGAKWNNVRNWRYDEEDDKCYISYKSDSPKTDAQCDKEYPIGKDMGFIFVRDNLLCKDGEFENSF